MMHKMQPLPGPTPSVTVNSTIVVTTDVVVPQSILQLSPPEIGEITVTPSKNLTNGILPMEDVTFIIPLKIDSDDRLKNFNATYHYLTKNLDTNIIIYEMDVESKIRLESYYNSVEYTKKYL